MRLRDKQLTYKFRKCGLQQHVLQVDDHTSIACWCEPSQAQDKQKPALLLIHGYGTSSTWQWDEQVKPLLRNFRLFLPDLVFFGKSSTDSPHRSEVFQAQMVAMAVEALGVSRYSVVGLSYGGFVAFRLAHLYPDKVDKVVLLSSGVCMNPKDSEGLLERGQVNVVSDLMLPRSPAAVRKLLRLSMHRAPTCVPSFIFQDAIQFFNTENVKERLELLDDLLIGKEDQEPLPTLPQKVLIIWGEHDGIFPLAMGHRLKEHLKDTAELAIVKNAAHAIQVEKPKEFRRLVRGFLLDDNVR